MAAGPFRVRPVQPAERRWLIEQLSERWGSPTIIRRGRERYAAKLPALVAELDRDCCGIATYVIEPPVAELISIESLRGGIGAGTALLRAVASEARAHGCERLIAVTTNDNLSALRFYQRRGLRLRELRPGAVDRARRHKPEIPRSGRFGIRIRDELELELPL